MRGGHERPQSGASVNELQARYDAACGTTEPDWSEVPRPEAGSFVGVHLDPRVLLALAEEMAAMAGEREAESSLAILPSHAALEAFVNETGAQEISSFKPRARFLPK